LLKLQKETLSSFIEWCKEQVLRLIDYFVETLPRAFMKRLLLLAPDYGKVYIYQLATYNTAM